MPLAEQAAGLGESRVRSGLSITGVALSTYADKATAEGAMAEMAAQKADPLPRYRILYNRLKKAGAVAALACPFTVTDACVS